MPCPLLAQSHKIVGQDYIIKYDEKATVSAFLSLFLSNYF